MRSVEFLRCAQDDRGVFFPSPSPEGDGDGFREIFFNSLRFKPQASEFLGVPHLSS